MPKTKTDTDLVDLCEVTAFIRRSQVKVAPFAMHPFSARMFIGW
jgi:hypothetical protein